MTLDIIPIDETQVAIDGLLFVALFNNANILSSPNKVLVAFMQGPSSNGFFP
jgi:hypothetical protein